MKLSKRYTVISCVPLTKETVPCVRIGKVLNNAGNKCAGCGVEATHVVRYTLKSESHRGVHVNVFAGKRMMTSDHILPRALGGADALTNLQLMCSSCNGKKGMLPSEAEIDRIIRDRSKHLRPSFQVEHQRYVVSKFPHLARLYDLPNEDGPALPFKRTVFKEKNGESRMKRVTRLSRGLVDNKHPHHPMWGWVRIFDRFPELKAYVTFV